MDKYKSVTDEVLLALLKKYQIPHGPIVGSTRKLYENKIYEYEKKQGQQRSIPSRSATCTGSTQKHHEKRIYEHENWQTQSSMPAGSPAYPGVKNLAKKEKAFSSETTCFKEPPRNRKHPEYGNEGSTMDKYKVYLTDDGLLAVLKKYRLPHGPIVASNRKLYEKKIYEYEKRQGQQQPIARSSAEYPDGVTITSSSQDSDSEEEGEARLGAAVKALSLGPSTEPEPNNQEPFQIDNPKPEALKKLTPELDSSEEPTPLTQASLKIRLASTRKLYEKKTYECMMIQGQQQPIARSSAEYPDGVTITSSSQDSDSEEEGEARLGAAVKALSLGPSTEPEPNNQEPFQIDNPKPEALKKLTPELDSSEEPTPLTQASLKIRLASTRKLYEKKTYECMMIQGQQQPIARSSAEYPGSTRKLYEKKIYEHETERTQLPSPGGSVSYTEPSSESYTRETFLSPRSGENLSYGREGESYTRETFVSPRSGENLSYGREALGSTRTYVRENYDSPRKEEYYPEYGNEALGSARTYIKENYDSPKEEYYSEYASEDPSPTKSSVGHSYGLTHHDERSTYKPEDWGANSSEGSTSSYRRYVSSLSSGTSPGSVNAHQPIAEPYPYSSGQKDVPTNRDSSSYQSIFYRKSPGSSSLGVEPRRAIHPEHQAQAAEKATGSNAETKRYLPFWPQLLLFGLLAGFLAFIYYFLQGGVKHPKQ